MKKLYSLCYFIPKVFKHYARKNRIKFLLVLVSVISSHAAETPLVRDMGSQQVLKLAKKLPIELQSKIASYLIPRSFIQAKNMECLRTLEGHTDWVRSVVFKRDGTQLASVSYYKTIKIWNPITGDELCTLQGDQWWKNSVWAFNNDDTLFASASYDKTIKIWNPTTGDELHTLKGHTGWINSIAFNANGTLLASASDDKTIKIWGIKPKKLDALNRFEEVATLDEASLIHYLDLCIFSRRLLSKNREVLAIAAEHQETIKRIQENHPLIYQTYKPYLEKKKHECNSTNKNNCCAII